MATGIHPNVEEECRSRQLVSIRSLALIVDPLRKYVQAQLMEVSKKTTPQDAFQWSLDNGYLLEYVRSNTKSLNDILDPKSFLDILKGNIIYTTKPIKDCAKELVHFRNKCCHNEFLECTDKATSAFFKSLKKITRQVVAQGAADPIINDIERWEQRKLFLMDKNINNMEDKQMIQEVLDVWHNTIQSTEENKEQMESLHLELGKLQNELREKIGELQNVTSQHTEEIGALRTDFDELRSTPSTVTNTFESNPLVHQGFNQHANSIVNNVYHNYGNSTRDQIDLPSRASQLSLENQDAYEGVNEDDELYEKALEKAKSNKKYLKDLSFSDESKLCVKLNINKKYLELAEENYKDEEDVHETFHKDNAPGKCKDLFQRLREEKALTIETLLWQLNKIKAINARNFLAKKINESQ
ncbi:unnamed protein product [Owenia fusiformis]|uniref:Uncharacterized protein n=1 Tax=Owenia fusiformis TaxID=6347 RepID=A0A8J1THI0_OWEFU|nr:unnamed protein product [Owenia fusiformis]